MKIEFIKETRPDGSTIYFTEVDGSYVSPSLSISEDKARVFYESIVKNKGKLLPGKEVIESVNLFELPSE